MSHHLKIKPILAILYVCSLYTICYVLCIHVCAFRCVYVHDVSALILVFSHTVQSKYVGTGHADITKL